jgi:hypothetical protein
MEGLAPLADDIIIPLVKYLNERSPRREDKPAAQDADKSGRDYLARRLLGSSPRYIQK